MQELSQVRNDHVNNDNDCNVVQEVNDTVEERVVLEYQLDQLKTIGSSDQLSD